MTDLDTDLPPEGEVLLDTMLRFSVRTALRGHLRNSLKLESNDPQLPSMVDTIMDDAKGALTDQLREQVLSGYKALANDFVREGTITSQDELDNYSSPIIISSLLTMILADRIRLVPIDSENLFEALANVPVVSKTLN
jgi:hypothetical protein